MRKLFLLLMFMLAGVFSAMGGEYIAYQPDAPIVISYSGDSGEQPRIPAGNFKCLSDGDVIILRITNIGSKSGDNAPKYKLITDSWETPTVTETEIKSTDGTISYTVGAGVAAKIKSSGLTISGQNYSLLDVVVVTASALSDTWTVVNVYNGSKACDSEGKQINITDRTYSDVKVGDILSINYSDASEGQGQIFLQYNWDGTHHDHGGLSGSGTVKITIDSDLLTALGSSAQVYGKNITVGTISIQRNVPYVSTVTDITNVGDYTLGNYISEQQINITNNIWTEVEVGDYLAINYTVKSDEEGELYIRYDWGGNYYNHSHLIGTSAMIYIEVDDSLKGYFNTIQLYCKKIAINSVSVVRNVETPGYRPVYIPSSGYATFYASSTCALPDGVKAYYVNGDDIESDLVKMTEIDNIPANTGVVLKGTTGIYQLYATDAIAASTTNNRLKGATTRTQITSEVTGMESSKSTTAYVLYNNSGSPEFRLINENTYLDAYKCYLETDGTKFASRLLVYFFDETSGIAQPENKSHECLALDKAYNLCGQRINVAKGLYIQNGKKYFAK